MSSILRAGDGAAQPRPRPVLPAVADRLLRRARLGTRDRLEGGGLAGGAPFPGAGARRSSARSFDDLAHPPLDRCRGPSGGVHVLSLIHISEPTRQAEIS